jgi:diaminopropionate ammonia-lyase
MSRSMNDCPAITCIVNDRAREARPGRVETHAFSSDVAKAVRHFHRTIPGYHPTPLVALDDLAAELGVARVWVKDESKRWGLNAFKVLGASYSLACALADRLRLEKEELDTDGFGLLMSPEIRERIEDEGITVVTATDGNHGRGVAWAARELGCDAVVVMPRGTAPARFDAIGALGADVSIIEGSYDEAVALAASEAKAHGWLLVQDTAWPGYEEIPRRIMQGYLTILDESLEQLRGEIPTHVLIPCGVGSLAAAMTAQFHELLGTTRPVVAVVEPVEAACCYQSMAARSDTPIRLEGDLDTIMAGLACGTPSTIAWRILRDYADAFVACEDDVARRGMRLLASPHGSDTAIVSGESGAVTAGLLACLLGECARTEHADVVRALALDSHSRVLLVSTEGDTDPASYAAIMNNL